MLSFKWFCISIVLLSMKVNASHRRFSRAAGDECSSEPGFEYCSFVFCENGGTCEEDRTTADCYKCRCPTGFTGLNCEKIVDITETDCNPVCQNGGTCNGNVCSCIEGYTGAACEIRDFCVPSNPCQNGGRCTSNDSGYVCDCTGTGFTGVICNDRIPTDPCLSTPCQNGGQCTSNNNVFSCRCVNGFSGSLCQIAPVPCASRPCINGGTCESTGVNTYRCSCPSDYTGIRCETSVLANHPCVTMAATTCQNGGTCAVNGVDYLCRCAPGWSGKNCETRVSVSVCDPNPCGAHGFCILAPSTNATLAFCSCEDRWTGRLCDFNLDSPCSAGYCENGGTCMSNGNIPFCTCRPTHTGPRCETAVSTGSPITTTTTTTSTSNITTTQAPTTCAARPCLNGGSCFNHGDSFICVCANRFTGARCDTVLVTTTSTVSSTTIRCANKPCLNSGTCYNTGDSYFCYCGSTFTGKNCETRRS